ncbi:family 78 glycoside hydrolase catalytic domain [Bythopirellula polymerisocia]|uniref:alpha-L-rhamnosidase n=1 Tax=Bythopirellula polymerisocia TaxID=2528003 RepID=A0A5C6CV77_9BACT|nr:family 78 glycoside hydrolase catalytic domain [Bythopirellula polymerisocia]TWU27725.1 Bacterial alpha-L-rhamnosidase [Bythopirellula polymerisocia]
MDEATRVEHLRCEYLTNPLGIDELHPRLSWVMQSGRRGARQIAWWIQVASTIQGLEAGQADLWDSGRVENDQTCQIEYEGANLCSRMTCHWQVTLWDERGDTTTSKPALWTMGLLKLSDWQARWITHDSAIIQRDPEAIQGTETQPGTPALFRKEFNLRGPILRATLYTTARGLLDFTLNGSRVTQDRFVPEWTDYNKRLHYRTFDVTDHLAQGANALGAMLGDGWWSGYIGWQETRGQYGTLENSLLLQLEIELEDGQILVCGSDRTWLCNTGPILFSDFMMGETYDARREHDGWDRAEFDDAEWLPVLEVEPPTIHIPHFGFSNNVQADTPEPLPLVAQRSEPVRVVERITPVSVNQVAADTFVYDLGQNIAGWIEISVTGPLGTRVQLRFGERLNPDGSLYTENLRRATATDVYVLKGSGEENWQPRFTFHGFQYVEISGLKTPLPLDSVRGCVVMSSTEPAGVFECSHPLVNRLWKNALWGQKGNFLSVPTDCPQRDERLGWMGDAQVFLRTATYNMDVAAFFTKWMVDVTDSQDVDGIFPDVAPRLREGENFVGLDGLGGGAGWADAGIIIPWTLWRVYGDCRIVERHWNAMVRWLDWLEIKNSDGIRSNNLGNNYGDWLCIPSDTSFRTQSEMKTLLATAFWAYDAAKMAQMARMLGKEREAERFDAIQQRVREAFQGKWLKGDGRLSVETQTAYLLALAFDLLPEKVRESAAEHLVENIEQLDWHLSTGFIGIGHLNPVLTTTGHSDVAYRLLAKEDYPSWLYPVLHGATTIWERWNGWTAEEGFFDPQMNSFNHYSLGSVCEWLYRHVAGIELDPDIAGFKHFVIKPYIGGALEHAGASYNSIHGTIRSRWERTETTFNLHVTVPANTKAKIYLPCEAESIMLEGETLEKCQYMQITDRIGEYTVILADSGTYRFLGRISQQMNSTS